MDNLRIDRLYIENFKGIKELTIEPGGKNATIHGKNGIGKSTVLNSFLWLLTGLDQNFKKPVVKPYSATGLEIHNLTVVVEAVIGGVRFRKEQREVWRKKRGSIHKELTGNTEVMYVDEVPLSAREFQDRVESILGSADTVKLLSSPFYFTSALPWQKRREILLSMLGEVSTEEVIASDASLAPLADILAKHSVSDYMKILSGRSKKINEEIKFIPAKINEVERMKPVAPAFTIEVLNKEIAVIKKKGLAVKAEIKGLEQIADLTPFRNIVSELHSARLEKANALKGKVNEAAHKAREAKDLLSRAELLSRRAKVLKDKIADRPKFDASQHESTCFACGQPLQEGKAEESFVKAELEESLILKERLAGIEPFNVKKATQESKKAKKDYENLKKGYETFMESADPRLEEAQAALNAAELTDNSAEIAEKRAELETLTVDYKILERYIADWSQIKVAGTRIAELRNDEETLADKFSGNEQDLFMLEDFIKTKVGMMEQTIVEGLGIDGLDVKLFHSQMNGGLKEVCEFTYNGVPYANISNSEQIKVGLRLIERLAKWKEVMLPVFVDNSESCTEYPDTDFQLLKLEVSPTDTVLRTEVEK